MIIRNDSNEIILDTESLHLYDVTESNVTKATVIVDGKLMTVKEFRETKRSDPRKGKFGRKARFEMSNDFS